MKLFITIIFFALTIKSFSQCTIVLHELHRTLDDSIVIGQKPLVVGGDYISNNPGHGSLDQFLFNRKYKTYSSDSIVPLDFRNIVKNYIIKKSGKLFYNSLKLEKVLVTNIDSIKKHESNSYLLKGNGYGIKKGKIKYHFAYSFFSENNIIYEFGISLDENGKIISKNVIPVRNDILDSTKTIKLCDCIEKIKRLIPKESTLRMTSFELNFDVKKNTLYYSIVFLDTASVEKRNGSYRYNFYTINSDLYTGKLSKMIQKRQIRGVF